MRIEVVSPPEGGKANEALERLVAETLGLPRRGVSVVLGHRSRSKVIEVQGLSEPEVARRLDQAADERP
jgi:uncharacterized protein YggU (UPF0235/DUF167 family)